MTEELKKQGGVDDAAAAGLVEETAAASTELDDAAKAAAEREARRQALYEENERAEDERARAEAERMRDVDDEDEDETPRDTWATVRRLWSEAAGDHWRFYIVFASIVFYVIFNTAAPAYSARVIDELWGHIQVAFVNNATFSITWENCGRTIFIYFLIWTAAASFYALQSFLMSSVAERLNLRLRNRIAQKLNRLPLAYFDAHRPGEVVSRATNDLDKMSESMQRGLLQLLVSIGTVVGAVSVMFVFSVQLTLVFLFFTALSLLVTKVVSRRTHDVTGERQEWVSKITSAVEEGYSGRLVIRAFNRERQSSAEVHEASKELARVSTKADFMINAVGPAVRFIGRLAQIVIALVGCSMLVAGHMTVGVFQAFFQFIYEASEPMTQLSFTFNSLQSALASAERVFDLLDEPEMEADPLPDEAAKLPGRVEAASPLSTCALAMRPTSRSCATCRLPPSRARRLPWWEPREQARRRSSTCSCAFTRSTAVALRLTAWIRAAWIAASCGISLAWCCRTPGCSTARLPRTSPTAAPRQRARRSWRLPVLRRSTSLCVPCRRATTRAWPTMPKASARASASC